MEITDLLLGDDILKKYETRITTIVAVLLSLLWIFGFHGRFKILLWQSRQFRGRTRNPESEQEKRQLTNRNDCG